ncbi:MAG TPA: SpoIIE family protein phosphatase [Candidatus Acidoferrum sp.]
MTPFRATLKEVWSRLTWPDLLSAVMVAAGLLASIFAFNGGFFSFLKYLAALAGLYLLVRLIGWWRNRLLWSLRNRLIVAYLFIALVPVLSVVLLAVQAGKLLYTQLGSYLLYQDWQRRTEMLADGTNQIASALSSRVAGVSPEVAERIVAAQEHEVYDARLPGLVVDFADDPKLFRRLVEPGKREFAGLVQQGKNLSLFAMRAVETTRGTRVIQLKIQVKPEFLATLAPDLGALLVEIMEPLSPNAGNVVPYRVGNQDYLRVDSLRAKGRLLQPPSGWFDPDIIGSSRFEAVRLYDDGRVVRGYPVVASFSARPSRLNSRMFTSIGELSYLNFIGFFTLAVLLLLIETVALITGIVMTRSITGAVSDLYRATQYVQGGDLTHRVRIARRDQLGELGESFNVMTGSISELIAEQNKRQRLENEISIAREVQNQLFPSTLPSVPGVEIEAICKAARSVSGDYYDFIQLSPTHIAIAIADISGKGISAALLMASLQAALRSQLLVEGSERLSMIELVSRLNKHLVRNTGDDRFATFFIAVYDSATRTLRYTNAGHLPAFLICKGGAQQLDKGGMVLGVLEDYAYEEGSITVAPDSLLIGYSDGLIEPENVYGEEFGIRRLQEAAVRVHAGAPLMVAESLMAAAEEWAGTPEQADDMTVIVARLR